MSREVDRSARRARTGEKLKEIGRDALSDIWIGNVKLEASGTEQAEKDKKGIHHKTGWQCVRGKM